MSVLRVGILGAGRSRAGLGPYFARWFESDEVGGRVVAIAGRDGARTAAVAASIGEDLGHGIDARHGIDGLLAPGDLDAVVIAAPPEAHLAGLEATLAAGIPTLCEKPLVPVEETDRAIEVCQRFGDAGVLLMENCQWPETLGAFGRLHPEFDADHPGEKFSMRLSPSQKGAAMLRDSLSHFLSMVQALGGSGADLRIDELRFSAEPHAECDALDVQMRFDGRVCAGRLELRHCPEQPRPAWYSVDGRSFHREVQMPEYRMVGRDGDRTVVLPDPLARLIARFAAAVRSTGTGRPLVDQGVPARARAFRDIVSRWEQSEAPGA